VALHDHARVVGEGARPLEARDPLRAQRGAAADGGRAPRVDPGAARHQGGAVQRAEAAARVHQAGGGAQHSAGQLRGQEEVRGRAEAGPAEEGWR